MRRDQGDADTPLPSPCLASEYGSTLLRIPAPGTGDNDHNPSRIRQRNLFDASIGDDNLFNGDRYKWSLQVTGVNMANKTALYNFLVYLQRNALCHSACADGGTRLPLLSGLRSTVCVRTQTFVWEPGRTADPSTARRDRSAALWMTKRR